MEDSLARRLRLVFPSGVDWEPDEAALELNDQARRLSDAFSDLRKVAHVNPQGRSRFSSEFAITHPSAPTFDEWIRHMDNKSKTNWIRQNNSFYVALWFKVSRVADFYIHYFNHWRPRDETGYLDIDLTIPPDDYWQSVVAAVVESLCAARFSHASKVMLNESVPFVLTWGGDAIPDDDPRWDDPDFEPEPVCACVYDCLFGDQ